MSKLSNYLRKRREELRITQLDIAREFNVTDRAIAHYEKGRRLPTLKTLLKYSRIYHVSIYKLIDFQIEDINEGETNDTNKNR